MTKHAMILSSLAVASTFASCADVSYRPSPDFCTNARGDETCAERYPDGSRPYCVVSECLDDFYGCFPDVPGENCASPCGLENPDCEGGTTMGSGSGSGSGTDTEGSESGSGSESSTTGPTPCVGDDECTDPDEPFCGTSGECGPCSGASDPDAACASADPLQPLCLEGECVACTPENPAACDEQMLLCDGDTNACVPCVEHAQCESSACELAVGRCFPPGEVIHVDGDGGQDFMSVALAVGSIEDGMHGVIVVHELDGQAAYQGSVTIDGGKAIALLAASGEQPVIQGTGGNPGLSAEGPGTILYMEGLRVAGNTMGLGIRANGAFVWIDRSRIVQNATGGVLAESGADLVLRNCFLGGDVSDVNAMTVNGASASILYSTTGAGFGSAMALACDAPAVVTVRNSLFVARTDDDEITCDATIEHSAAELDLGGDNIALGGMATTWFSGYAAGDFSLSAMHPATIDTAALWQVGDPSTDIDGDPRPDMDGTPDHAGADVP